ncbi:hypothetical protein EYF80_043991 [Liparis tanakae]|uniref:Uncharacterized protein n=1 Tax=Liparis tanakae TaxID=230148 RepID=A0A4Z2FYN1_9TELE|nr:hypothetical protein EYF80_043991 [Liparis tanakae]
MVSKNWNGSMYSRGLGSPLWLAATGEKGLFARRCCLFLSSVKFAEAFYGVRAPLPGEQSEERSEDMSHLRTKSPLISANQMTPNSHLSWSRYTPPSRSNSQCRPWQNAGNIAKAGTAATVTEIAERENGTNRIGPAWRIALMRTRYDCRVTRETRGSFVPTASAFDLVEDARVKRQGERRRRIGRFNRSEKE